MMFKELERFNLINPLSVDLFENLESLFLEYGYNEHDGELESMLENAIEGDNLNSTLLNMYNEHIDFILNSLGIKVEATLRFKIDLLEALQTLTDLDKLLGVEILNSIDSCITNAEVLETMVEEFMKTGASGFDIMNMVVEPSLIDNLKMVLRTNDLDTDDLHKLSHYSLIQKEITKTYNFKDIVIFLSTVFSVEIDNEDKVKIIPNLKDTIGVLLQKITIIYLSLDNVTYEEFIVMIRDLITDEYKEQIMNALQSEIRRFDNE